MKPTKLLRLLVLSFMALMVACSDDRPDSLGPKDEEEEIPAKSEYYISYMVDDVLNNDVYKQRAAR